MPKKRMIIGHTVKCTNCGFMGYRSGGVSEDGGTYLENKFWECHLDSRDKLNDGESYIYYSEDGDSWNVAGCLHRVWSLWGSGRKDEKEKAKKLLTERRNCKYYIPYQSGYEPAGHNEMRRDKENHRIMLYVGIVNAVAVLLAAVFTIILRG